MRASLCLFLIALVTVRSQSTVNPHPIIRDGNICYRLVNEQTMCNKQWQDTGGCNGNCDSLPKCAAHTNWGTPGFLVHRTNPSFCASCTSTTEIGGGNGNYDLYEYVECPAAAALQISTDQWTQTGNLGVGETIWSDRSYTFGTVDQDFIGAPYVLFPHRDMVSFTVTTNIEATICFFVRVGETGGTSWPISGFAEDDREVSWSGASYTTYCSTDAISSVSFSPSANFGGGVFTIPTANPITGWELVGNGWCTNGGSRVGLYDNWHSTTVRSDKGANLCEQLCNDDSSCVGYQTEDGSKCQLMPGTLHGASFSSFDGVDGEKRNWCWRKPRPNPPAADEPSTAPSTVPTSSPSKSPSISVPTSSPSQSPSEAPSKAPTTSPSTSPTTSPSTSPTSSPSTAPTSAPTSNPSKTPSETPSFAPTTDSPSVAPTTSPSKVPTTSPSRSPSESPSTSPTSSPSTAPSTAPTTAPTVPPSKSPSVAPTGAPTSNPSKSPSDAPSFAPTAKEFIVKVKGFHGSPEDFKATENDRRMEYSIFDFLVKKQSRLMAMAREEQKTEHAPLQD